MSCAALIPLARFSAVTSARERTPSMRKAETFGIKWPRGQQGALSLARGLSPARRAVLMCAEEPGKNAPKDEPEELPPWVRREMEREAAAAAPADLPFFVYLLGSAIIAIAATGSVSEYVVGNPIFGVIAKDSPLWAPILLTFAITGFPSSIFLFVKCIAAANAESERADKIDGFR